MGEISDYFKRERYITRRLSLLVLAGTAFLTPIAIAAAHRRIPPGVLPGAIAAYVACAAFAVVLIVRGARAKFPKSALPDHAPLDGATRRKLARRIWFLEFLLAVYVIALVYAVSQIHHAPRWPTLIGPAMNLLIEAALIKAILRLKKKMKAATGAATSADRNSASQPAKGI